MSPFSLKFFSRTILLAFSLLVGQFAFCWGLTGHRIVAEIAQNHLSEKAKKEISKLIGNEPLAWWANWPDFIKSDTSWKYVSKWHYVDLPGNMDKASFISSLKALEGKNLYTQIQEMQVQLKDKSLSVEKRRIALSFLIHFVGDLHQPLHVGRTGTEGGNKMRVYWFNNKTNLHAIWDEALIDFQQYSYTEYAKILERQRNIPATAWTSTKLDDWFYESHKLSDKIYDYNPADTLLSYKYNFAFQKDLNDQLLKGGLRLAKLLNETFK